MKPADVRKRCARLKVYADKYLRMKMDATYRNAVNEHNALAHAYNQRHKRKIELI